MVGAHCAELGSETKKEQTLKYHCTLDLDKRLESLDGRSPQADQRRGTARAISLAGVPYPTTLSSRPILTDTGP